MSEPEAEAATALALASLLADPDIRVRSRVAADRLRTRLGSLDAWDPHELAGTLADADTMAALRRSQTPDQEGGRAAERVRAALARAAVPSAVAARAVQAAATTARMRRMAQALDGPERAAAFERRRVDVGASSEHELRRPETASAAVAATLARSAVSVLDEELKALAGVVDVLAAELSANAPDTAAASDALAARLAAAGTERRRRADRLTELLLARAKPDAVPVLPPSVPDPDQLDWLRVMIGPSLYTRRDAEDGAAWLGSDPFRLRDLPSAPPFLAHLDPAALPPALIAPLLRRIDLTRGEPSASQLSIAALRRDAGPVSRHTRPPEQRRWWRDAEREAPPLPPVTEIPRLLHAIWLGGAPSAGTAFLRNLGYAAQRYAGEIDVVLWTDLPRATLGNPADDPDDAMRHLTTWARAHGVILVNVFEVFHATAPMATHAQFVLEMSKQHPGGYAAASDLLRLEVVERFGGLYADGDLEYADQHAGRRDESQRDGPVSSERGQQSTNQDPENAVREPAGSVRTASDLRTDNLVEFLDRLAASDLGFTMDPLPEGGIGNDVVAGPARHPAIRLWLEETRVNYFRSHAQIFGGLPAMALPYVGEDRCAMRYVAPSRTGRVHHHVLDVLGLTGPDLPATQPPFRFNSVGSWIPRADGRVDKGGRKAVREPVAVLERCLTFLEWQLAAREGDLYLAAIAPVVRALPDPDAAWTALLTALSALSARRPGGTACVTSVTDVRRRDDRVVERADLPPEAQALLVRHALRPATQDAGGIEPADWLGAGLSSSAQDGAVWLVDDRVEAAALCDARGPVPPPLDQFAPLTEVAFDLLGRPVGLWIRRDAQVRHWRRPERFALVPRGWVGVSVGAAPGSDWPTQWPLVPETVAGLLAGARAGGRPVLLCAPWGGKAAASVFARRLGVLIEQRVDVVEGPLRATEAGLGYTAPMPVTYRAFADVGEG